jgi:hypothetical protein
VRHRHEEGIQDLSDPAGYIYDPAILSMEAAARWSMLCRIRELVKRGDLVDMKPTIINHQRLPPQPAPGTPLRPVG